MPQWRLVGYLVDDECLTNFLNTVQGRKLTAVNRKPLPCVREYGYPREYRVITGILDKDGEHRSRIEYMEKVG